MHSTSGGRFRASANFGNGEDSNLSMLTRNALTRERSHFSLQCQTRSQYGEEQHPHSSSFSAQKSHRRHNTSAAASFFIPTAHADEIYGDEAEGGLFTGNHSRPIHAIRSHVHGVSPGQTSYIADLGESAVAAERTHFQCTSLSSSPGTPGALAVSGAATASTADEPVTAKIGRALLSWVPKAEAASETDSPELMSAEEIAVTDPAYLPRPPPETYPYLDRGEVPSGSPDDLGVDTSNEAIEAQRRADAQARFQRKIDEMMNMPIGEFEAMVAHYKERMRERKTEQARQHHVEDDGHNGSANKTQPQPEFGKLLPEPEAVEAEVNQDTVLQMVFSEYMHEERERQRAAEERRRKAIEQKRLEIASRVPTVDLDDPNRDGGASQPAEDTTIIGRWLHSVFAKPKPPKEGEGGSAGENSLLQNEGNSAAAPDVEDNLSSNSGAKFREYGVQDYAPLGENSDGGAAAPNSGAADQNASQQDERAKRKAALVEAMENAPKEDLSLIQMEHEMARAELAQRSGKEQVEERKPPPMEDKETFIARVFGRGGGGDSKEAHKAADPKSSADENKTLSWRERIWGDPQMLQNSQGSRKSAAAQPRTRNERAPSPPARAMDDCDPHMVSPPPTVQKQPEVEDPFSKDPTPTAPPPPPAPVQPSFLDSLTKKFHLNGAKSEKKAGDDASPTAHENAPVAPTTNTNTNTKTGYPEFDDFDPTIISPSPTPEQEAAAEEAFRKYAPPPEPAPGAAPSEEQPSVLGKVKKLFEVDLLDLLKNAAEKQREQEREQQEGLPYEEDGEHPLTPDQQLANDRVRRAREEIKRNLAAKKEAQKAARAERRARGEVVNSDDDDEDLYGTFPPHPLLQQQQQQQQQQESAAATGQTMPSAGAAPVTPTPAFPQPPLSTAVPPVNPTENTVPPPPLPPQQQPHVEGRRGAQFGSLTGKDALSHPAHSAHPTYRRADPNYNGDVTVHEGEIPDDLRKQAEDAEVERRRRLIAEEREDGRRRKFFGMMYPRHERKRKEAAAEEKMQRAREEETRLAAERAAEAKAQAEARRLDQQHQQQAASTNAAPLHFEEPFELAVPHAPNIPEELPKKIDKLVPRPDKASYGTPVNAAAPPVPNASAPQPPRPLQEPQSQSGRVTPEELREIHEKHKANQQQKKTEEVPPAPKADPANNNKEEQPQKKKRVETTDAPWWDLAALWKTIRDQGKGAISEVKQLEGRINANEGAAVVPVAPPTGGTAATTTSNISSSSSAAPPATQKQPRQGAPVPRPNPSVANKEAAPTTTPPPPAKPATKTKPPEEEDATPWWDVMAHWKRTRQENFGNTERDANGDAVRPPPETNKESLRRRYKEKEEKDAARREELKQRQMELEALELQALVEAERAREERLRQSGAVKEISFYSLLPKFLRPPAPPSAEELEARAREAKERLALQRRAYEVAEKDAFLRWFYGDKTFMNMKNRESRRKRETAESGGAAGSAPPTASVSPAEEELRRRGEAEYERYLEFRRSEEEREQREKREAAAAALLAKEKAASAPAPTPSAAQPQAMPPQKQQQQPQPSSAPPPPAAQPLQAPAKAVAPPPTAAAPQAPTPAGNPPAGAKTGESPQPPAPTPEKVSPFQRHSVTRILRRREDGTTEVLPPDSPKLARNQPQAQSQQQQQQQQQQQPKKETERPPAKPVAPATPQQSPAQPPKPATGAKEVAIPASFVVSFHTNDNCFGQLVHPNV